MTELERINLARLGRGLRALAAAELPARQALLEKYESNATPPEERARIRQELRRMDRPEEARTASPVPRWARARHDGRLAACGADG